MNLKGFLSPVSLVSILVGGIVYGQGSYASPLRDRVCSFYRGETVIERKTCKVDYFNSGSIKIYTNNGTLNFDLLSVRGKVHSLKFKGSIWAHTSNPEKLVCMTACGTEGNKLPWYKLVWSQ